MTAKKMVILTMTMETLREALQLPPEAEVVRIELDPGFRGVMRMVVEGVGWPTREGSPIHPAMCATVREEQDAAGKLTRTFDWHLPSIA